MNEVVDEINYGTVAVSPHSSDPFLVDSPGTTGEYFTQQYIQAVDPTGTSGGNVTEEYLFLGSELDALKTATRVVQRLGRSSLGKQARDLIGALHRTLELSAEFGLNPGSIPQLHPGVGDDDSLLFEWIHPSFRLGFGLEDDESHSSWFLVTDESLGSIAGSGYLSDVDLAKLTQWLTNFLILHS